jgi:hypothetical protein
VQSSGTRPAFRASALRNVDSDAGPPQVDDEIIGEVAALKTLTGQLGQLADQITKDVVAEPTIPPHSTAGQSDRTNDAPASIQQEKERQVVNEQEQSIPFKPANEDFEDLMLIVEELSNFPAKDLDIVWNQLSENSQQRTAEQWKPLYTDEVLPTYKAKQLIALMNKRKLDRLMPRAAERITASSIQLHQPTNTALHKSRENVKDIHVPSQVAYVTQGQIGTQVNPTPRTDGDAQQSCINGILRLKDCKRVNIASNESGSGGKSMPADGQTHRAPKIITGEMVFEGCEDVNILVSQNLVQSLHKRQNRSHKNTRISAQPAHIDVQPRAPKEQQGQKPQQIAPQAPPVVQPLRPEAPLSAQSHAQSRPPTQFPVQTQSYGPPPPPQTFGQHLTQLYGQPLPPMQLPPLTHAYGPPPMHYTYDPLRPQVNQGGPVQAQSHAAQHQPQTHPNSGPPPVLQRWTEAARQQFQEVMPGMVPFDLTGLDAVARPYRGGMREPDGYGEEGDNVYLDDDEDDEDGEDAEDAEELGTDEEYV